MSIYKECKRSRTSFPLLEALEAPKIYLWGACQNSSLDVPHYLAVKLKKPFNGNCELNSGVSYAMFCFPKRSSMPYGILLEVPESPRLWKYFKPSKEINYLGCDIWYYMTRSSSTWIAITLKEGNKREIWNRLQALGLRELCLIRTQFVIIKLGEHTSQAWQGVPDSH